MESGELRIFKAVAQEGSITKAALSLGYVQSNVTARIRQLETELKTPLFYRQRGMILTPAGERLLKYAEQILHLLDEAGKSLNETGVPAGSLAIGAYHSISSLHLPDVLAKYHKTYPDVDLSLFTGPSDELLDKVLKYELDGAFVKHTAAGDDSIVRELEISEELVIVARPEYTDIAELAGKPFLMNTAGCPNRHQLESWLQFKGFGKVRYMEFNHTDFIIQGVLSDLGASFIPRSAVRLYEDKGLLRTFPVPSRFSSTKTYFIRHKDSIKTSALAQFIETIQDAAPYLVPLPLESHWREAGI